MPPVKDIMNALYTAYKKFEETKDVKAYNRTVNELDKLYLADTLYQHMRLGFAARINTELGH